MNTLRTIAFSSLTSTTRGHAPLLILAALFAALPATLPAQRHWGVAPLPIIAYSPDTGGMFGAAAIFFYGPDVGVPEEQRQGFRNNTAAVNAIVTTNGSWIGALSGTNFLQDERYRWDNAVYGNRAPGVYFGIGDDTDDMETYLAETVGVETTLSRRIVQNLFIGPLYQYEWTSILETDDDGALSGPDWSGSGDSGSERTVGGPETGGNTGEETILGSDGTTVVSGPGIAVIWDSTGGVFWPTRGARANGEIRTFSEITGSTSDFGLYSLRYVQYIPVAGRHVLAVQGRFHGSWGEVPFQHLPSIGGDGVMRGLLAGRYRDTVAAIAGAEYRVPVGRSLGVVAFGSVGQVGPDLGSMDMKELKSAVGLGFRVALNREQKLNLRIDIAVSPDGLAPYVNMGEAY
ncbi:MAG: BamA/TamA family outer membrane protein [Alkalispirochaeta sp.]